MIKKFISRREAIKIATSSVIGLSIPNLLSASESHQTSMRIATPNPPPTMLLRYYVPSKHRQEHIDELLRTCEQIGASEVLLFSSDYICTEVFLSGTALSEHIKHLAFCAERIRGAGLVFSLNVMHTLGHLYIPDKEVKQYGFQRQLMADGKNGMNPGQIDPACPNLKKYLAEIYRLYGKLEPRLLFVDDDYKVPMTQCFAPSRVARFAKVWGCSPDANTINGLLHAADINTRFRARKSMCDLVTEDLVLLSQRLREAVHSEAPSVRLGLMHAGQVFYHVEPVARALAGAHRPFVRPQIPLYREDTTTSKYPSRFWNANVWKAFLPSDFEFFPECENYPYDAALKSPSAAYAQYASILGTGESRVALSLNSFSTVVPACESRALVEWFASHRRQIEKATHLLGSGSTQLGAGVWSDLLGRTVEFAEEPEVSTILVSGIPLRGATSPQDGVIHWGDALSRATISEIEQLLKRGAVLDATAALALEKRGLLSQTGLQLGERCGLEDLLHAQFARTDGTPEFWPFYYFISRIPGNQHFPFKASAKEASSLAKYYGIDGQESAPLILTWKNPQGVPFSFINLQMSRFSSALDCPWGRKAIVRAIEWVHGSFGVRVIGGNNLNFKLLRLPAGKGYLATLCNFSTAPAESVELKLDEEMTKLKWSYIVEDGSSSPVNCESNTTCLKKSLPCLGVIFLHATSK